MWNFKREELENAELLDNAPVEMLQRMNKHFKIEYEFNDGKVSQINIPK